MVRVCPAGSEVSAPHAPVATTSPAEHEPPCRKPGAGGLDLGCNVALYRPGRPDPASPVRTVPLRSGNDGVVQLDRLTFCCLSQNPALKASHNRPPMQAPVSKSGSADIAPCVNAPCVHHGSTWESEVRARGLRSNLTVGRRLCDSTGGTPSIGIGDKMNPTIYTRYWALR